MSDELPDEALRRRFQALGDEWADHVSRHPLPRPTGRPVPAPRGAGRGRGPRAVPRVRAAWFTRPVLTGAAVLVVVAGVWLVPTVGGRSAGPSAGVAGRSTDVRPGGGPSAGPTPGAGTGPQASGTPGQGSTVGQGTAPGPRPSGPATGASSSAAASTAATGTPGSSNPACPAVDLAATDLLDAAGRGNTAFAVGGVTVDGSGPLGSTAARFDGSTGWVRTTTVLPAAFFTTVALWFRTSRPGGILAQYAISPTDPVPSSYDRHLYMTATGQLAFGTYDTQRRHIVSAQDYADGRWHLAVASVGVRGLRLVVDGVLVASDTRYTYGQTTDGAWRIGWGGGGWPAMTTRTRFDGAIAHVATWSTQLSDAEIAVLDGARTSQQFRDAVMSTSIRSSGYWPLGHRSTTGTGCAS